MHFVVLSSSVSHLTSGRLGCIRNGVKSFQICRLPVSSRLWLDILPTTSMTVDLGVVIDDLLVGVLVSVTGILHLAVDLGLDLVQVFGPGGAKTSVGHLHLHDVC